MPLAPSFHFVRCRLYWPTRCALKSTSIKIAGPLTAGRAVTILIDYDSILSVGEIPVVASEWTRVDVSFELPFNGSVCEFRNWIATPNGKRSALDRVVTLHNAFVDHLKAAFPSHRDLDCIRHFGPAEWPYTQFSVGDRVVFEVLNGAIRASVAAVKQDVLLPQLQAGKLLSFPFRALIRARDLTECGYPTEALLLAFAVMDASVQSVLQNGMARMGLRKESIDAMLRNTTQSRLATFLDATMKLVFGTSLAEQDESTFSGMQRFNRLRNDAIHNGCEVQRSEARQACQCCFDVLEFLKRFACPELEIPPKPVFFDP